MLRGRQILEVRRAHVIHILRVERTQLVGSLERSTTGIVGALEVFLRRVKRHRFIEIEIANVIDRQLVVEAEAVGEIEFHWVPASKAINEQISSCKTISFH